MRVHMRLTREAAVCAGRMGGEVRFCHVKHAQPTLMFRALAHTSQPHPQPAGLNAICLRIRVRAQPPARTLPLHDRKLLYVLSGGCRCRHSARLCRPPWPQGEWHTIKAARKKPSEKKRETSVTTPKIAPNSLRGSLLEEGGSGNNKAQAEGGGREE